MKKRGPIIGIVGLVMILISFAIIQSIIPNSDPTMSSELLIPAMFEGMFDETFPETQILPGDSHVFSFQTTTSEVPLLWGTQIIDYQNGDELLIKISDIFGADFGTYRQNDFITFELFMIPQAADYNFEIQNTGTRLVSMILMISEDPDNSPAMTDPDSTLMNIVFPLVVTGILSIIGIIVLPIGVILTIYDWKKGSNRARYI